MKMKTIIVDDDASVRLILSRHIEKTPFLELTAEFSSAIAASDYISRTPVDVILLDVNMPELNGLDLIKAVNNEKHQIILVTSDPKYAVQAFEMNVSDYLLKPITYERFLKSMLKAKKVFDMMMGYKGGVSAEDENIFAKVNGRYVKIDINDILIVEALADYVSIYTSDKRYIVHSTMKAMLNKLPSNKFCRIHNSYIVRLDKIMQIEDNTITINQKLVPISRSHYKELKEHLKLL